MQTLDQIRQERIKKKQALEQQKINPYPSFSGRRMAITDARNKMDETVAVTGRVISLRGHGQLVFADLTDETGKIQLMFKSDVLNGKVFDNLKLIDIGD